MPDLLQRNFLLIVVAVGHNLWESAKLAWHLFQHLFAHPMAK
jgi:hypothetical protein